MGDIIPNQVFFKFHKLTNDTKKSKFVELGNVTMKVHNIGVGLVINVFTNVSDLRFVTTADLYTDGKTNILIGVGLHSDFFDNKKFGHNSLSSIKHLSYYINSVSTFFG